MFKGYEDTARLGHQFVETGMKSFAGVQAGLQAIAVESGEYSRKALETGAASVEKLLAARSPEKAIEIQSDYVKQAYAGFVAQSSRMSELFADMAKEAYKPFETMAVKAS